MPRLRIVGDGERDAAVLPAIVRGILKAEFTHIAKPWPRLHRGQKKVPGYSLKGYGLKLLYVIRSARLSGDDGVVACTDADTERRRERLGQMIAAREADRSQNPPLPTALGEAKPHNEAWLLDDPVAVREGLWLASDHAIPNVNASDYPKEDLEALQAVSERCSERPTDVWPDIAARLNLDRCNHKKTTGLMAFAQELEEEITPLFEQVG